MKRLAYLPAVTFALVILGLSGCKTIDLAISNIAPAANSPVVANAQVTAFG